MDHRSRGSARGAIAAVLAALLAVSGATSALAQARPPAEELASIRETVLHAEYRPALRQALAYLERTDLAASERNSGLEVLAIIHLALRDDDAAQAVLHELFERDPGHRMADSDAGPIVRSAFVRARELAHPVTVRLDAARCVASDDGARRVEARVVEAASAVASVRAMLRRQGETDWSIVDGALAAGGAITLALPAAGEEEPPVEYYLSAMSPSGAMLGQLGSPEEPLVCGPDDAAEESVVALDPPLDEPPPPAPTSSEAEWWPWVVGGIVLVAGGIGVGVGLYVADESARPSFGQIALPLVRF